MDGGGFLMDNMDPTLSELGDEFTLGDIDGKEHLSFIFILKALSVSLASREVSLIS